jgi:hypothetical protein
MEGILVMCGKHVRRGYALPDCNIMDLMPTILYLMGLKILSDIDGKVLEDAFTLSYTKRRSVTVEEATLPPTIQKRYTLTKEEEERVKERLKALGYIG